MRKAALFAPLVLAGCNLAPQYRQPIAPVSDRFAGAAPAASPAAAETRLATDLGWSEFFGDPRLRALIDAALTNNRDLAQSLARVAQARAQYRIEASARLPQLDINGGYTKSRQPLGAIPLPGGLGSESAAVTLENWTTNVAVASFELDLWGRVRNLSEVARAQYLGTVQGARAYRLSLISQVAAAYYTILSGEERIALAERTLAGREEGVTIARRRLDAGVTSTVDYDQTVLLATQARADLAALQQQTGQARNLLDVLVGGPVAGTLPAARPLADSRQFARLDAGLPSALLLNRPDILEAEYQLLAANANIGAARAAFFPTISLTGQFGYVAPEVGDLFKANTRTWSYGANLSLPIFDWGRRRAQLRVSKAQADELAAAYQRAIQQAFREVADALVGRQALAQQIAAVEQTVATQQRLARTARQRYDQGLSIYLQVLDAERSLFAAQQQLIDLRSTVLQNDVALYVALGGGQRVRAADPIPPSDTP
ncbi:efflux transporter outer membrane subunit [Sphingomonas aracearum]|uniref:RND transporter n=1 Tax=Sphingomonas aracearum TaxID=2283317 RepID=A0A369W268_9SPHN|nr:efflux transporter outer membrane subunit [Sphingomonas aracearum]RDE07372.1 RND transporter [Sphingomonas aracearum]